MRVTDIEINSGDNRIMDLNLRTPRLTDKYLVKGIYGLDSDAIVPRYYATSLADGSTPFLRMGMKQREITIRLALSPNWGIGETYSELRDQLYRGIASSRSGLLQMVFKASATSVAYADVRVTKFEVPYSTKESEVQITFQSDDPLFRSLSSVEYVTADFGTDGWLSVADSISTAPHGMFFDVTFTAAATDLVIQDDDTTPTWAFTITPASSFASGDRLEIQTEYGERSVVHYPSGGGSTSMLDRIEPGSVWPTVFPGENQFYMPGIVASEHSAPDISFMAAFWGV